jgi:pimeloyl-ACP methyl ester carboxylesterase
MSNFNSLARTIEAGARPTVIALHCSGATGSQWRQLGRDLGRRFLVVAPNLIGAGGAERWAGDQSFRLSDEAASILSYIDAAKRPVHLVGHSYGGSVALRCAIERPTQVASLTLYEPAALYVLKTMGPDGTIALADIAAVASDIGRLVSNGAYQLAAKRFVEYLNGEGSWTAISAETRDGLVRNISKVCLEISAELNERTPLVAYRRLNCPVLLLQGENSPEPMRMIARQLARAMRLASLQTVYGVSHMAPINNAAVVNAMMASHIVSAEARQTRNVGEFEPAIQLAA